MALEEILLVGATALSRRTRFDFAGQGKVHEEFHGSIEASVRVIAGIAEHSHRRPGVRDWNGNWILTVGSTLIVTARRLTCASTRT
jgi:hypothetical protein